MPLRSAVQRIIDRQDLGSSKSASSTVSKLCLELVDTYPPEDLYEIASLLHSAPDSFAKDSLRPDRNPIDLTHAQLVARELANQTYRHQIARQSNLVNVPAPDVAAGKLELALDDIYEELKVHAGVLETPEPVDEREFLDKFNALTPSDFAYKKPDLDGLQFLGYKWYRQPERPALFPRNFGLKEHRILWIAGPHRSGKTALLHWIARRSAIGPHKPIELYPPVDSYFPIFVSAQALSESPNPDALHGHLKTLMTRLGGKALCETFRDEFFRENVLLLCDDLSSFGGASDQIRLLELLSRFDNQLEGNRLLVTSRSVPRKVPASFPHPELLQLLEPGARGCCRLILKRIAAEDAARGVSNDAIQEFLPPTDYVKARVQIVFRPGMASLLPSFWRQFKRYPHNQAEFFRFEREFLPNQGHLQEMAALERSLDTNSHPVQALVELCESEGRSWWAPVIAGAWSLVPSMHHCAAGFLHELQQRTTSTNADNALYFRLLVESLAECRPLPEDDLDGALVHIATSLQGPLDWHIRMTLCEALGRCYILPGAHSTPLWMELTRHENWQVRLEATRLIARLPKERMMVAGGHWVLEGILSREYDVDIKACASFGLMYSGLMGNAQMAKWIAYWVALRADSDSIPISVSSPCLTLFHTHSKCPDVKVRLQMTHALKFFPNHPVATASMIHLVQDPEPNVAAEALSALAHWECEPEFFPILNNIPASSDRNLRYHLVELARAWIDHREAVSLLLQLQTDSDWKVNEAAGTALSSWVPKASEWMEVVALLDHPNKRTPSSAVHILSRNQVPAEVETAIHERLVSPNPQSRLQAVEIHKSWGKLPAAWSALLMLLEESDSETYLAAAKLLRTDAVREQALPVLLRLLNHVDYEMRAIATQSLSAWAPNQAIEGPLIGRLDDDFSRVRGSALEVLKLWDPMPNVVPKVIELLGDLYPFVRSNAVSILEIWKLESSALDHLHQLLTHPKEDVRFTAQNALKGWTRPKPVRERR